MRVASALCLLGVLIFASGCGSRQEASPPLVSGTLEGGMFWKNPLGSTSNEGGGGFDKDSRVDVYNQFVVVTTPNGISRVYAHGFYSDLEIKRD